MLEQRELERLGALGVQKDHRWLIVVLRVRVDGRDLWCHDSVANLAKWSDISEREIVRAVGGGADDRHPGLLVKLGIVELGPSSTVTGGSGRGGIRTYRPRRVRPLAEWVRPAGVAIPEGHAQQAQATGDRPRPSSRLVTPGASIDRASQARNPDTYSRDLPERLLDLWTTGRRGLERYRFTDAKAIGTLRAGIARAIARGQLADVQEAIREKAQESYANPADLDEWVAAKAAAREDRERETETRRRREEADRDRDAAIAAERERLRAKHPGKSMREIAELEATGSRLTLVGDLAGMATRRTA